MTTEIAVLNKLAVAMAADSAATIGDGEKIYNIANKIFDLSNEQPLGMMIYGNLEFMGLPFEVLIKEFRNSHAKPNYDAVSECVDDFLRFLQQDVSTNNEDENNRVLSILNHFYRGLRRQISQATDSWLRRIETLPEGYTGEFPPLADTINRVLSYQIEMRQQLDPANCFSDTSAAKLVQRYIEVHKLVAGAFLDERRKDSATDELLETLSGEVLYRTQMSGLHTGIVVAGFGLNERCPSLRYFETDGVIDGELKWNNCDSIDIGRRTSGAEILTFAQSDVAELFLSEISPDIEEYMVHYTQQLLHEVMLQINALNTGEGQDQENDTVANDGEEAPASPTHTDTSSRSLREIIEDYKKTLADRKNISRERIQNMVRLMPVQELVILAESLVEITSLKRRVTDDLETVGGAVDVVAITRSEGLVWIKRKHYFDPKLNPRFFHRQKTYTPTKEDPNGYEAPPDGAGISES